MDPAWKVLTLLCAAVACQYALQRAVDRLRLRRRGEGPPPRPDVS